MVYALSASPFYMRLGKAGVVRAYPIRPDGVLQLIPRDLCFGV
jgi:hypothetical protein